MEIKEAIEILKHLKDDLLKSEEYVECFSMAISALKKQDEKKPVVRTVDIDRLVEWRRAHRKYFDCPNCGFLLKTESWTTVRCFGSGTMLKDNSEISFCPQCGQKIDWTE